MEDGGIGTDINKIMAAIESVYSKDGVVILVDLGSAVMSSEMAIEMLPENENIKIIDAPIIESSIFGAVESAIGASMERMLEVFEEVKAYKKF
jgi:dihydroxyacetone kinase DhaKLM complex PTS-EIIA-like component DhaM